MTISQHQARNDLGAPLEWLFCPDQLTLCVVKLRWT
jgi:hypothetical protein